MSCKPLSLAVFNVGPMCEFKLIWIFANTTWSDAIVPLLLPEKSWMISLRPSYLLELRSLPLLKVPIWRPLLPFNHLVLLPRKKFTLRICTLGPFVLAFLFLTLWTTSVSLLCQKPPFHWFHLIMHMGALLVLLICCIWVTMEPPHLLNSSQELSTFLREWHTSESSFSLSFTCLMLYSAREQVNSQCHGVQGALSICECHCRFSWTHLCREV